MTSILKNLALGAAAGTSSLLPGVSAATIFLIAGYYDKLIRSLSDTVDRFIYYPKKDVGQEKQGEHFKFLITVVVGGFLGLAAFSSVIGMITSNMLNLLFSLFAGVLLLTGFLLFRSNLELKLRYLTFFVFGLVISFFLYVGSSLFGSIANLPLLLFAGFLAGAAMIIPGASGSSFLILLGQYEYLLSLLNEAFSNRLFHFSISQSLSISVFGFGLISGIAIGSMLLRDILQDHLEFYLSFISGLIVGTGLSSFHQALSVSGSIDFLILLTLVGVGGSSVVIFESKFGSLSFVSSDSVS